MTGACRVVSGTYNIELVNDSLYEWNVKLLKWVLTTSLLVLQYQYDGGFVVG